MTTLIPKFDFQNGLTTPVGAINRPINEKLSDAISVLDFGADSTGANDSSTAFQNAINSLATLGGEILIPSGTWNLNTVLDWDNKSIYWNISPGATFTGTASGSGVDKFPAMITNTGQTAVGPYTRSYNNTTANVAANNVEIVAAVTAPAGASVAQYLGATGSSPTANSDVWGQNIVVTANGSAAGIYQGIEVDIGNGSTSSICNGIQITGAGTQPISTGLIIDHQVGMAVGISANSFNDYGVVLNPLSTATSNAIGLLIGPDFAGQTKTTGTAIGVQQFANAKDTILIERATNTVATGYAIRLLNQGGNTQLWSLDVSGNINMGGSTLTAGLVQTSQAASATGTGVLSIGNAVSATATAGAATLPAQPLGFLIAYIGSTPIKIPYYSA